MQPLTAPPRDHLTEDEDIRLKARVAMSMAKSMHNRLKKYKEESATWQANTTPEK